MDEEPQQWPDAESEKVLRGAGLVAILDRAQAIVAASRPSKCWARFVLLAPCSPSTALSLLRLILRLCDMG